MIPRFLYRLDLLAALVLLAAAGFLATARPAPATATAGPPPEDTPPPTAATAEQTAITCSNPWPCDDPTPEPKGLAWGGYQPALRLYADAAPAWTTSASYQPVIRLSASTDPTLLTSYCQGAAVSTVKTADYPQVGEGKLFATFQYNGLGYAFLSDGIVTKTVGLDQPGPPPWNEQCSGAPCTIYMPVTQGRPNHVYLAVQGDPICHGVLTASIWDWVIFITP